MDGELRASNGTFAYVFADPTPANNGWYVKSGGWNTGSWNPSAPPAQDGVNAVWLDGGEGSKILNCHFENGRVLVDRSVRGEYELFIPGGIAKNRDLSMLDDNVYRVTSIAAHARRSMSRIFDQTSVEVGSPFNEIIAVPAGALARGAQVRIIMVAQTSGNGGNKSMRVAFGPAGSETTLAALTIPTGGRTSVIEIILRDSGSGRIASAIVQTMTADGPSADVVNLTGLDLEAVDYRLVLSGSVAANGDTMNMRHVAVEANSAFTDTPSYA
jgi:hypothetical protein